MRKTIYYVIVSTFLFLLVVGCGNSNAQNLAIAEEEVIDKQDALEEQNVSDEQDALEEQNISDNQNESENQDASEEQKLSEEQALDAIKKYCYTANPDLERIVDEGEYSVYWDISSSDENEIVVLFVSYTGAETRYYIDRNTGDAYVTEYVPGIFDEEQKTDEVLNVRDYLN